MTSSCVPKRPAKLTASKFSELSVCLRPLVLSSHTCLAISGRSAAQRARQLFTSSRSSSTLCGRLVARSHFRCDSSQRGPQPRRHHGTIARVFVSSEAENLGVDNDASLPEILKLWRAARLDRRRLWNRSEPVVPAVVPDIQAQAPAQDLSVSAVQILSSPDPSTKVAFTHAAWEGAYSGHFSCAGGATPPERPSRLPLPQVGLQTLSGLDS